MQEKIKEAEDYPRTMHKRLKDEITRLQRKLKEKDAYYKIKYNNMSNIYTKVIENMSKDYSFEISLQYIKVEGVFEEILYSDRKARRY